MTDRSIAAIIFAILLLNIIDAGFTLYWVHAGYATEANPVLEDFAHVADRFLTVKLGLASLGLIQLWLRRDSAVAEVGLMVCLLTYVWVVGVHTFFAASL